MITQIDLFNAKTIFIGAIFSLLFIFSGNIYFFFVDEKGGNWYSNLSILNVLFMILPIVISLFATFNKLILAENHLTFTRVLGKRKTVLWKNILSIERKEYASSKNSIRLMVNYFDGKVKRIELLLNSEADFEILQVSCLSNKKRISFSEY